MLRMKWRTRFMELAEHVSTWSKDPSTQVGAVIVSPDRKRVDFGYNGFPRGVEDTDERLGDRTVKYTMVVHAEANAILNSTESVEGCSIYVWPLPPCSECAKLIIQSGITKVFYAATAKAHERMADYEGAIAMMREAGLLVEEVATDSCMP